MQALSDSSAVTLKKGETGICLRDEGSRKLLRSTLVGKPGLEEWVAPGGKRFWLAGRGRAG